MSKKQSELSLLVPGARGWEIWQKEADGGYVRVSEGEVARAADLGGLAGGQLAMLFPVRSFHAMPFRASSGDESLFEDLTAMHAERLGVRADPMGGQLSDTFAVSREEESAVLLGVVLKTPGEGELPPRSPKEFDLSARAFPVQGDAIAVWMEFGRWVFAFYQQGRLLYAQATSSAAESPDESLVREIRLALGQLAIQGLSFKPAAVHVWSDAATAGSLAGAFGVPANAGPRPDPVLPEPRSKLLPADVRAARREARTRHQRLAAIAAVILLYLGVGAWFGYGLWKDHSKIKKLTAQAEAIAPQAEILAYAEHDALWAELTQVVEDSRAPVEVLKRVTDAALRSPGVRMKTAEITGTEIRLQGEAQQNQPISQFSLNLTRPSFGLSQYKWETPAPTNTAKGWDFIFVGTLAGEATP